MKARRIFWHKFELHNKFLVELNIYEVGNPIQYPSGIKYRLACIDLSTGKKVIVDNHHPKGHHLHLDECEWPYEFKDVHGLMLDFKNFVAEHLKVQL
jgi:hypothetical protein